jgi:hypothetical protein
MTLIFWYLGFMIAGDLLAYRSDALLNTNGVILQLGRVSGALLLVAFGGMAPFSVGDRAEKGGSCRHGVTVGEKAVMANALQAVRKACDIARDSRLAAELAEPG